MAMMTTSLWRQGIILSALAGVHACAPPPSPTTAEALPPPVAAVPAQPVAAAAPEEEPSRAPPDVAALVSERVAYTAAPVVNGTLAQPVTEAPNPLDAKLIAAPRYRCAESYAGIGNWPFDVALLKRAVAASAASRGRTNPFPANKVKVAVLDTGIDNVGDAPGDVFPLAAFGLVGDNVTNLYRQIGTNAGDPAEATTQALRDGSDTASHGVSTAGMVLGGVGFADHFPPADAPIRLRVVNLIDPYVGSVSDTAVYAAMLDSLSDQSGVSIANVSYELSASAVANFAGTDPKNVLWVVAAGNVENDNTETPRMLGGNARVTYPAILGGVNETVQNLEKWRERVLTVASIERSGSLAPFSVYGRKHVQIAAPGCQVPAYLFDGETKPVDGTSISAPIVTFAAALIMAELDALDVPDDALAVRTKKRLIATGDRNEALADYVADGKTLNIYRAVAVNADIADLRSGGHDFLKLLGWPDNRGNRLLKECRSPDSYPPNTSTSIALENIVAMKVEGDVILAAWTGRRNSSDLIYQCQKADNVGMPVRDLSDGTEKAMDWDAVSFIFMREYEAWR